MEFTSKAVSDKCDLGFVMTKIGEKTWNSLIPQLRIAAREGKIDTNLLETPPTHVIDIYKMRRGRYKNVRIWIYLDLGNGYRKDLFMTNADNTPLNINFDIFTYYKDSIITNWKDVI